jgi:hypothetical protein
MVLCTTLPTWQDAVRAYRRRWATEGSYRDAQSGWDGQHGWDLEPVLTPARTAGHGERLVGLWALGALLQTWLGSQVAHGPDRVRAVAAQWTTTSHLSVWAQGQLALREPLLTPWVAQTLRAGGRRACRGRAPGRPAAPAGAGHGVSAPSATGGLRERCPYATSCPLLWTAVAAGHCYRNRAGGQGA